MDSLPGFAPGWQPCSIRLPAPFSATCSCHIRWVVCAATSRSSSSGVDVEAFSQLLKYQQALCEVLETVDGGESRFCSDAWSRPDESYGMTRGLQAGLVSEKAGLNTSLVQGINSKERAGAVRTRGAPLPPWFPLQSSGAAVCYPFSIDFRSMSLFSLR
jgi:Coproporphyrinogen III oxidase